MITIITSLYNSEKYLPSFLENTKKIHTELKNKEIEFEHILISNQTNEIENKYLKENENDFYIEKVELESIYKSWNRGINKSKFEYVTFWNVDDTRSSEAIIDGIRKLGAGANLVYFPFIYKRYLNILNLNILVKKYKIDPPEFTKEEFTKKMHCGPHFIFNKKLISEIDTFDETFKIVGDFEWCSRAAKQFEFSKSNVISGEFKSYGSGLSTKSKNANLKELKRINNENNNSVAS